MNHITNSKTILINKSRDACIIEKNIKFADSYFKRLKGLMLVKKLNYGLVFIIPESKLRNILPKSSTIHTLFMLMEINVVFLNENNKVVDITTLKPWKSYSPVVTCVEDKIKYIVELRKNLDINNKIFIGDELDFVCDQS